MTVYIIVLDTLVSYVFWKMFFYLQRERKVVESKFHVKKNKLNGSKKYTKC